MAKKSIKVAPKQRVLVDFIQDRSGSMCSTWKDCLGGFASFIEDLRKNPEVEYLISLTAFDTTVDRIYTAIPLGKINPAILEDYGPRGGTALYDALGDTILATETAESFVDKVIYIIVTDGEENASRRFAKDIASLEYQSLHTLIDRKIREGKSTFQYIGAQPESWTDAKAIGLSAGQTVRYDLGSTGAMYGAIASGVNNFSCSAFRSTQSMTADFADETLIKAANLTVSK
jgi:hypothetical protein